MTESKFQPGDIVVLKSGGPEMVVDFLEQVHERLFVICAWFKDRQRFCERFSPESLAKKNRPLDPWLIFGTDPKTPGRLSVDTFIPLDDTGPWAVILEGFVELLDDLSSKTQHELISHLTDLIKDHPPTTEAASNPPS